MEHNHDNQIGKRLLALLVFIITLPLVILGLVVFGAIYLLTTVLPSPIERLIYKRSEFYKELGAPYTMSITHSLAYKSYKYVKANGALEIVVQSNGYYYYRSGNCILVIPYYPRYEYENREWLVSTDDRAGKFSVASLKSVFAPIIEENIDGYELKLLVKKKHFSKIDYELAKDEPIFVFYKNKKDFAAIKI